MKTIFFSLCLLVGAIGLAKSQVQAPRKPAFELAPSARRALVEKALTLKPGDTFQSVTNALGKPTFDQSLDRKDGRNVGRSLKYYAVIWEIGLVNELQDERVAIYLDERGRVRSVHIKMTLE